MEAPPKSNDERDILANELTTVNGANTYSYDGNGNLTGGAGWSLDYNAKNQTTSITKPGGTALTPLAYEGADQTQRTQAGTTSYVNSALGVASATPGSGSDFYTRDNRGTLVSLRAASGSKFYYLLDGLGSVVGLINSSGTKVNSYSYDPYGKQLSATEAVANPWRYASGQFDSQTGLTKFGFRYYDPDLGRFTQRDPSGKDLPYAYAACDPINYADPSGAQSCGTISVSIFENRSGQNWTKTYFFEVQSEFTFSYTARVYGLAPGSFYSPGGVYDVTVGGFPLSGGFRFSATFPWAVEDISLDFFSTTIVGFCEAYGVGDITSGGGLTA